MRRYVYHRKRGFTTELPQSRNEKNEKNEKNEIGQQGTSYTISARKLPYGIKKARKTGSISSKMQKNSNLEIF